MTCNLLVRYRCTNPRQRDPIPDSFCCRHPFHFLYPQILSQNQAPNNDANGVVGFVAKLLPLGFADG
jgi:hypothetical protein